MNDHEAQAVWRDYYSRIRCRRIDEAEQLIAASRHHGLTDQSGIFLDFLHFSSVRADIEQLEEQLSENYDVSVVNADSPDYWHLKGTTRPVEMAVDKDQLIAWVAFMADVAQSHSCVFSTWTLTDAMTGNHWESQSL